MPALLVLYVIITYWSVIVFIFWVLVALAIVLMLVGLWAACRRFLPRKKPGRTSTAPTEDYTKWPTSKWRTWEQRHLKEIASGKKRERPTDLSLWTNEERLDWEKEEWLRVVIKNEV